jgi:hypothetical protein
MRVLTFAARILALLTLASASASAAQVSTALPPSKVRAASCATLVAAIDAAQPGETVQLQRGSDCPAIVITARKTAQLDVNAGFSRVRGVTFRKAQNIRWRSGTVSAPGGAMVLGKEGYGFNLDGSCGIAINGVRITDANRGIAGGNGCDISITDNTFVGIGQDSMILAKIDGLQVLRNHGSGTIGKPTSCTTAAATLHGLSKAACVAIAGQWTDGFHADFLQLRNGIKRARIAFNVYLGRQQGIVQMDTPGDAALEDVVIEDNRGITENNHPITLGECIRCIIRRNFVDRPAGLIKRAVIIAGKAVECDNVVQGVRSRPCAAKP